MRDAPIHLSKLFTSHPYSIKRNSIIDGNKHNWKVIAIVSPLGKTLHVVEYTGNSNTISFKATNQEVNYTLKIENQKEQSNAGEEEAYRIIWDNEVGMSLYEYELYGDFSLAPISSADMMTSNCCGVFYWNPNNVNIKWKLWKIYFSKKKVSKLSFEFSQHN